MSDSAKKIWRNFLSVVAGVFVTIIIIMPIAIFVAFMSFSDSSVPRSQEIFLNLLLIFGATFSCIMGGYITAKISHRKELFAGIITGMVLTLLLTLVNDFELNWQNPDTGIAYLCILPAVLIGVYLGIKKKNTTIKL